MARRLGALAAALALAGLVLLLARDRPDRTFRATPGETVPPDPAGLPETPLATTRGQEEEPAPGRATISGRVRYSDGSAAPGRRIQVGPSLWTDTDEDGRFRFRDAEPGGYFAAVDGAFLLRFQIAVGEVRDLDIEIARGHVGGIVLDAETGEPINEVTVLLGPDRWGLASFTGRNGRFEFPTVPPGTHRLVALDAASNRCYSEPLSAYETETVACPVGGSDVDLAFRLRRARPLQVRFENVPSAWRSELPLALVFKDRLGQLPDLACGSGEVPLWLDDAGRLRHPPPAPPPGEYDMVTVATRRQPIPWLSQPLSVPKGPVVEQTIRLPDGGSVVLEFPWATREHTCFLRVGPILVMENAVAELRIPYVPEGRQGIWLLCTRYEVRVGEVTVTAGREVRIAQPPGGSAALRGRLDPPSDELVVLRDERDEVIASQWRWSYDFEFGLLPAGSYVFEAGDLRFPVTLAEGETKDLGILRGSPNTR